MFWSFFSHGNSLFFFLSQLLPLLSHTESAFDVPSYRNSVEPYFSSCVLFWLYCPKQKHGISKPFWEMQCYWGNCSSFIGSWLHWQKNLDNRVRRKLNDHFIRVWERKITRQQTEKKKNNSPGGQRWLGGRENHVFWVRVQKGRQVQQPRSTRRYRREPEFQRHSENAKKRWKEKEGKSCFGESELRKRAGWAAVRHCASSVQSCIWKRLPEEEVHHWIEAIFISHLLITSLVNQPAGGVVTWPGAWQTQVD